MQCFPRFAGCLKQALIAPLPPKQAVSPMIFVGKEISSLCQNTLHCIAIIDAHMSMIVMCLEHIALLS